jgi:hypothetical protein
MRFHFIPISWCGRHTVVLAAGRGLEQVVLLGGHHGGVWIGRIDVGRYFGRQIVACEVNACRHLFILKYDIIIT